MKRLLILLLSISGALFSQEKKEFFLKKNSFNINLVGQGLSFSVDYSRVISQKENYFVQASLGVGVVPVGGFSIPHQLTYNLGKRSSFLELGIGGTYLQSKTNSSGYEDTVYSYQLSPIVGWRKHFKNDLILRIYANPLIHVSGVYIYEDYAIVPFAGISLGYGF